MKAISQGFAIDHRSIRLFRLLLGCLLILQTIELWPNIRDFMTDEGVYPRVLLLLLPNSLSSRFPLSWSGSYAWAAIWVSSVAVWGVLLVRGTAPRLVSALAFLTLLCLHHRMGPILFGADKLLRVLLFWSVFLPSSRPPDGEKAVVSGVSVAVLLQVALFYIIAGFAKSKFAWWDRAFASYIALQGDIYATVLGRWLAGQAEFLRLATRYVWILERFGWLLIFVGWRQGAIRMIPFALFASMHIAFGLCLHLGLFPLVDVTLLVLFLPTWFWDRFELSRLFDLPLGAPQAALARWWSAAAGPVALAVVSLFFWSAFSNLPHQPVAMPRPLNRAMSVTGLSQSWNFFAPEPYRRDGWWVALGVDARGHAVDLFSFGSREIRFEKPADVALSYPHSRWVQYLYGLGDEASLHGVNSEALAQYFCSAWERRKRERLRQVYVYFVHEHTPEPPKPIKSWPQVVMNYICPAGEFGAGRG